MPQRLGRGPAQQAPGISEVSIAHLYRGEIYRSTNWRTRLDTTTNWAITTAAAVISFSFSNADSPHPTLLAGAGLVFTFLVVEARRYRYYDLWAQRVRLLEAGFWGPLLRREPVTADFFAAFAGEMVGPRLRIGMFESLAFRMKRTYWPIIGLLLASWLIKVDVHPVPAATLREFVRRAHLGPIPGTITMALWALAAAAYVFILVAGYRFPLPPTELRAPGRRRRAPLAAAFRTVGPEGRLRVHPRPPRRGAAAGDAARA
jgi:uncharacterized membrane protein